MPAMVKTKLAVLAVGLLAMQMTDSAQGNATGPGAAPLPATSTPITFLSAAMSLARGYIPLGPIRPNARPAQTPTGAGGGPVNYGPGGLDPNLYRYADFENLRAKGHVGASLIGDVSVTGTELPWVPIRITVTCNGEATFTTTTDPKGGFVIAQNQRFDTIRVIGREKSFVAQFIGCTVTAALPGFQSTQLTIANRDVQTGPNIGSIKLTREESAGSAVSTTTADAPKEALKSFHKARENWLSAKPDRAERELQKALEIYPQFAEAWYQLGILQATSKSPEAFNSFSRAAAEDPKFVLPYEHMAALSAAAGHWQKVVDETNRALELNPRGNLDIWFYHALGNYQLKNLDVAQASAARSLSMDPLHVQLATEQLLAVILSAKHDQHGALQHLRNCLTYFPPGPNVELVNRQIAQIESALAEKPATREPDFDATPELDSRATSDDADVSAGANSSCQLEEVLPHVSRHVEEFVEDVDRFAANEVLVHKLFDRDGSLKSEAESRSYYIASIQKQQSGLYAVSEFRGETQGTRLEGTIKANISAALVLIFHPSHIGEFAITCAGPSDWAGYNTWRVDFRQRMDRPATMSGFEVGNSEYTILLKGSAWIDRYNYQIVHMETDLLQPIPEMKLKTLHQSVDYASVSFAGGATTLWLPQTAEVTAEFRGKRLKERHTYTQFQIFSVNTEDKLKLLSASPN